MPSALSSSSAPIVRLKRNPKLLDTLRARSCNPNVRIVAFKLTRDADSAAIREAVHAIFATGAADYVVHNDLAQRAAQGAFPADIWQSDAIVAHCANRRALATELEKLLVDGLAPQIEDARRETLAP